MRAIGAACQRIEPASAGHAAEPDDWAVVSHSDRVALVTATSVLREARDSISANRVGAKTVATWTGKDAKGAVVPGDAGAQRVAVRVVRRASLLAWCGRPRPYTQPEPTPDVLQGAPSRYARHGASGLRTKRARSGAQRLPRPARVHVEIATTFHRGPSGRCRRDPGAAQDERSCASPRSGAGRQRQCERRWHAPRHRDRHSPRDPRAADSTTAADAHLPVARRDSRQRTLAERRRGAREAGGRDDVARHDRRGPEQDRRHLPDREVARPIGALAATVRSAFGVGRRPSRPRARAWSSAQRSAPCGRAAPRPGDWLGRADQPL